MHMVQARTAMAPTRMPPAVGAYRTHRHMHDRWSPHPSTDAVHLWHDGRDGHDGPIMSVWTVPRRSI